MALDGLRERLRQQQLEMRNGDHLLDLVRAASELVGAATPRQTGTLGLNLSSSTPVREDSSGLHAGLGDRSKVGREDAGAPRHTIEDFLDDFPQFRTPKPQRQNGDKAHAWWDLPLLGKIELQDAREAGAYGGGNQGVAEDMSAYFFQQDGGLDGWANSASKAGITPTGFVRQALEEWRGTALPAVLAVWKARMGLT